MRFTVLSGSREAPLNERETAPFETPARAATSLMVTRRRRSDIRRGYYRPPSAPGRIGTRTADGMSLAILRSTQYARGVLESGLDILRIVAEADHPLTATSIAQRVGLHVSSVSRTLGVLVRHGYLRKPTYHSFAADLGLLALAGRSASSLTEITATLAPVERLAGDTGLQATLAALHHDEVLYLHQSQHGRTTSAVAGGYPLHLSVVGLRLLLDLPAPRAVEVLSMAARRYGWDRPTPGTPADPESCLTRARAQIQDGVLRIDAWGDPSVLAAAVAVTVPGRAPLALALVGPRPPGDADAFVREHLARGAEHLRSALI
ncbi:hypothetical protein E4V99_16920 [Microbacterium sp. dk485]|nr:hypothetical protein E4V99_16920 [Microbacterium sp. dk485]